MANKPKSKKEDELSVHFPDVEIEIDGQKATMRPMRIEHLALFMQAFTSIRNTVALFMPNGETEDQFQNDAVVGLIAADILPMLPFCIEGVDILKATAGELPKVLRVWIEQNLNDEILKNYLALAGVVKERAARLSAVAAPPSLEHCNDLLAGATPGKR